MASRAYRRLIRLALALIAGLALLAPVRVTWAGSTGGWCWFADPRAIAANGETFVGSLSGEGRVLVTALGDGHVADLWGSSFEVDDHDNPALAQLPDGRIVAFFSRHVGSEAYMVVGDGRSFVRPVALQLGSPTYTYPTPIMLGDRLFLFWRGNVSPGAWWYSSTEDLETWTPAKPFAPWTYVKASLAGDRILFAASQHADDPGNDGIWHFTYDGSTFSEPVLVDAQRAWIWDIAPGPTIAYATFPSTSDHRYRIASLETDGWTSREVAQGGGTIAASNFPAGNAQPFYSGGIVLDHDNPSIAYASIQEGADWNIYRIDGAGATRLTDGGKHVRPFVVAGQVLWLTGRYDSYVDYDQRTGKL